ncbi:MAG TPA: hypothetical protein PKD86_01425 [Gemmatales bacterium]|nr:hypothetical protein [Gemmatales bacterium]HMP57986.1 hypothetical protein [Gemmatales bacterium]
MIRLCLYLIAWGLWCEPAQSQGATRLEERFAPGQVFRVTSRSNLRGTIQVNKGEGKEPQQVSLTGTSTLDYHERVLTLDQAGLAQKTLRLYRQLDYQRQIGDQPQSHSLRSVTRRRVIWRTERGQIDSFSPDGALTWSELDQARWELFTPLLAGLLPRQPVRVGERWAAATPLVLALTDLETLETGEIGCTLREIVGRAGRNVVVIAFSGTVAGVNADGSNRQRLEGTAHFDLQDQCVVHLTLSATSWMLNPQGQEVGRIEGQFTLDRQRAPVPELADAALRGLVLDPMPGNTLILFDEPGVGASFTYPRSWTLRKADPKQIILDGPGGAGLLLTLEPLAKVPTIEQFKQEASTTLARQAFKVLRQPTIRRVATQPFLIDQFVVEVEAANRTPLLFDYYVIRQTAGGATVAARYTPTQAADSQRAVEVIVRSLRLDAR